MRRAQVPVGVALVGQVGVATSTGYEPGALQVFDLCRSRYPNKCAEFWRICSPHLGFSVVSAATWCGLRLKNWV
ncbi:hypothetical protein BD779DRAFT_1571478, partial [Infundibulicybe gibba]